MTLEDDPDDSQESSANSSTNYLSLEERMRAKLERAIRTEDDTLIARAWVPQCAQYESLQKYLPRVEEAKKRVAAFGQFRSALATNNDAIIVRHFDPILNGYPPISSQEWQRLSEAVTVFFSSCTFGHGGGEQWKQATLLRRFIDACRTNDDESIISTFQAIQAAGYLMYFGFTAQELDRVDRAKRSVGAYQHFREALRKRILRSIHEAYLDVLKLYVELIPEEQEQAELALRFIDTFDAHKKEDEAHVTPEEDKELVAVYKEVEGSSYSEPFQFTHDELEWVQRTQQRIEDLKKVRAALKNGRPLEIVRAYEAALFLNENHLTMDEHAQLVLAKRYIEAYRAQGNSAAHPAVIEIFNEIAASPYSERFLFTPQEAAGASGKMPVDSQQARPSSAEELELIVIVEGAAINKKLFWQVYHIKQQYIWLRQGQLEAMSNAPSDFRRWIAAQIGVTQELYNLSEVEKRRVAQQVLDDILDGFSTKKEISSLAREDKRKVGQRLRTLFEEVIQREGFEYQQFLQTYGLTDDNVKDVLDIYARREFLTEDLAKRNKPAIDRWLMSQRQSLVIQSPEQDQPEEPRASRSSSLKSLLRVVDWFGEHDTRKR